MKYSSVDTHGFSNEEIGNAYDFQSWFYGGTAAFVERSYHLKALEQAAIKGNEAVLEVAVGPGMIFLELIKRLNKNVVLHGIDISDKMLAKTSERLLKEGHKNFKLLNCDARNTPFEGASFDMIYSGYMLDLIPLTDIPKILNEMHRLLKPGGRIVLLNLSKKDKKHSFYERLYHVVPKAVNLRLMGACRPLLMEEFIDEAKWLRFERTFVKGLIPSEIAIAYKK